MKNILKYLAAAGALLVCLGGVNAQQIMEKPLTAAEKRVIIDKGTEAPFTGKYCNFKEPGTYVCRQCGAALYRSTDKFDSGCGWPAFDDQIGASVRRIPDPDGQRIEIICARCGAHLGHVFEGEGFTSKNTRYCVNSVSLDFVPAGSRGTAAAAGGGRTGGTEGAGQVNGAAADGAGKTPSTVNAAAAAIPTGAKKAEAPRTTEVAYFAGGCFWGVEYLMRKAPGVILTEVGYAGGRTENPTYEQVCAHNTGHAEAVKVVFDPVVVSYETLAKLFFEIHDPTQVDRQGPDVGDQYRSEIFFTSPEQKATAEKLISILRGKGYKVATKVEPAGTFYRAEEYHQDYYDRRGSRPYCHAYTKRF